MAYQVHGNDASYEPTSVFLLHLKFKCYVLQVDTEICEETFAWLTKYMETTRHMNQHRFFFYILNFCDLKNEKIEEALNSRKK